MPSDEYEPNATRLVVRKRRGNVVELGSIAAFGFSPLWLLAAGADVTNGTRVYLDAFVRELKVAGVLAEEAHLRSVDELLAALAGGSGTAARLIDIPPLELAALRRSLADLRADASGLPSPTEMASLFDGLGPRPSASGAACSRSRPASGSPSSTRRGTSVASTCSIRTARISRHSATKASVATPRASPARTARRSRATSIPRGRRLTERGVDKLRGSA